LTMPIKMGMIIKINKKEALKCIISNFDDTKQQGLFLLLQQKSYVAVNRITCLP